MGYLGDVVLGHNFHFDYTKLAFWAIPFLLIVYVVCTVIYRLFLHPLAKFPGPRIAATTHLYEIFWDHFRHGAYLWEIERMHQKYGPIVRVNPLELSIRDSNFYHEVYVHGHVRRTEALATFGDGMDFNGSHLMTVDHHLHRQRRKPLEPFFSKAGVARFEAAMSQIVTLLVDRLKQSIGSGEVVRLDHALTAFAGDIVSRLCIEEPKMSFLNDSNFSPDWHELFHTVVRSMPLFMAFPWIIKLVRIVPLSLLTKLDKRSLVFRDWREMAAKEIEHSMKKKDLGGTLVWKEGSRKAPTVFDHLVHSDLPESDLNPERLASEAQVLLGASNITTPSALTHLIVYIMLRPHVEKRLRDELAAVSHTSTDNTLAPLRTLEKLPFLQACIKEGLRLSHGPVHRLPRISPDEELMYKGWVIPRGTPVGMSSYFMHTDPEVYPKPHEFIPERWLGDDIDPRMHKNWVPFSRGSRGCLAPDLALSEMSMVLAALFSPCGPKLELFETDASDVDPVCSFLLPMPRLDSKGVRVLVK